MVQNEHIGRPSIISKELIQNVNSLTYNNRRMSINTIVCILQGSDQIPHPSYGTVWKIRHDLGYNYLPPTDTFYITEGKRVKRLAFCQTNLQANTN